LMERAQAKVERGVDVAKQCSESLDEIVQNIERVSGLAQEISNASREQSLGLSEISKAMSQLDASTQVNASASDEAAHSAEALSKQTESLRTAAQELVQAIMGGGAALQEVHVPVIKVEKFEAEESGEMAS
jgi:methyl-accepting chemotaxis protein